MTVLDVTDTAFIDDLTVEESNDWMEHNIGKLIRDGYELSEGEGWKLYWEPESQRWIMTIKDESKALLFSLRWL